jgi:hypothetical protein
MPIQLKPGGSPVKKILSILAVAALVASCGPPPDTIYDDTDQDNSSCKAAPFHSGTGEQGDFCSNAKFDCDVVCCPACPLDDTNGGDTSFWASECYRGRCDLDPTDVCNDVCAERGQE